MLIRYDLVESIDDKSERCKERYARDNKDYEFLIKMVVASEAEGGCWFLYSCVHPSHVKLKRLNEALLMA